MAKKTFIPNIDRPVATEPTRLTLGDLDPAHIAEAQAHGLSAEELLIICQAEADRTRELLANPVIYPARERHLKITDKEARKLGFAGRGPLSTDIKGFPGLEDDDFLSELGRDIGDQGYPIKGKGKGKRRSGDASKRLADPAVVFVEVSRILKDVPDAETCDDFVVLEFNGEFLDERKGRVLSRHLQFDRQERAPPGRF